MTYNQPSYSQAFSPNESNHFTYNYTSPTNKKAQVVLFGPMIGKVTHNTARILIEFSVDRDFTCTLQPASGGWKTCTRRCKARVPQVFTFEGLKPKTFYNVFFDCELPVLSSFWTLRENNDNPGVLNVAVMSCNEISHQEEKVQQGKDQWVGLGERVARHELDYIFHIGDQVYMDMGKNEKDCPYQRIHSILKKIPQSCWETEKPRLLEMLREQYRKTWAQYKSIAYVLANVPNLTICDDHEFRDDWGYLDEDHEKGTIDNFYGQLARQVYYEYQRQLREDIPWNNLASLKCEYYHEVLHNVGISFMEYRGCRSWFREARLKETHMGANQLKWIESLYKPGGAFDNLKSTLFISPVPLYFLSHNMSKVARLEGNDVQEEFTYDSISQLKHLLDLLRNWKVRNTHRQIALIGGDVHMGGFTKIYYKGEWILTQMVSSAINGKAITNTEKKVVDVLQHIGNKSGDYKFEQKGWVKENNYGLIEVRDDNSFSSMKLNLVRSSVV